MTIDAALEQTTEMYRGSSGKSVKREVTEDELAAARERIGQAKAEGTATAVFEAAECLAILPSGEYADVAKELKDAVPQLDLRELKGVVSRLRKPKRAVEAGEYPEFVVNDRQLREMGDEAIQHLKRANVPPTLFVRSRTLCQVVEDERGRPVIANLTEDGIVSRLAKICDFVFATEDGPKNVVPPRHLAAYIVAEAMWPFPALEAVTRSPTIRYNGSIAQLPGYDPETKLFYHRPSVDEAVDVSENPTKEQVAASCDLIDELLHDFPFDCQASRANAIALLLSPIIQSATMDVTPLVLIDAPTAGSGKGLLAIVAGLVCNGATPDFTTAPTKDDEWTKKITAILSAGPSLVVIDNVKYALQSAELAMVLTAMTWQDRVLGKNTETVVLPNRATWVATGNNIQLGGDIPRRCIWIRIDPKRSKPHERLGFLHPNLEQWVSANRGRLLSALLTLCRSWYAAGCPEYPIPAFGSFETWSRTVGGILAHAGVIGFLENRDRLWEQSDTESTEWESFLTNWLEVYGSSPVTPKELVRDIEAESAIAEAVPASISDAVQGKGNVYSKLGYQFKSRLGRRYGLRGLRLEKGPQKSYGNTWLVVEDSLDGAATLHINSRSKASNVEGVESRLPQTQEQSQLYAEDIPPCENGLKVKSPPHPSTVHRTDENCEDF